MCGTVEWDENVKLDNKTVCDCWICGNVEWDIM